MFPIIIPSNLGKNQKPNPPKIETLENYTHLTKEEFTKHFNKNINDKSIGLFEAMDLIGIFYNFDKETEKKKSKVVDFVEDPEYGTLKYYFRKWFKK
jgi:hypothetical protein